jgi:2-keto-4-pentenoate hydratase/2-oxohepta-3-ene-1,7-dioic acid hydratase in catechol pathway
VQLVTIDSREVAGRPGVLTSTGEILDLAVAPSTLDQAQWIPQSVISVLAAGEEGLERVSSLCAEAEDPSLRKSLLAAGALLPAQATQLMAPVRRPGLILLTESFATAAQEPLPVATIKSPHTACGPGRAIRLPWPEIRGARVSVQLGVVLGSALYRATAADAAEAIAAYTVLMDFSLPEPEATDNASWRSYVDSKQFPDACPMGPALITADELRDAGRVSLRLDINGVNGEAFALNLSDLPIVLARLSARYGFRPGDVIGFGAEAGQAEARPLRDGDRLLACLGAELALPAQLFFAA